MEYLHTMVRVGNLEKSLEFYCSALGMVEVRREDRPQGEYTLIFHAMPADIQKFGKTSAPLLELTYNWNEHDYSGGRNFGHLAYSVDNIYDFCRRIMDQGITINRPPRDGHMAFIRSPDGISIEIIQKGESLPPQEPWSSMPNTGTW